MWKRYRNFVLVLVLFGAGITFLNLAVEQNNLRNGYVYAGYFPTSDAGQRGALKELSRLIRRAPYARHYTVSWDYEGTTNGPSVASRILSYNPATGGFQVRFEVAGTIRTTLKNVSAADIHQVAHQSGNLVDLKKRVKAGS